jgi:hypothetical protein
VNYWEIIADIEEAERRSRKGRSRKGRSRKGSEKQKGVRAKY